MIGKRFSSDDEVLGRLRRLERRVNSIQRGSSIVGPAKDDFIDLVIVEWMTDDYVVLATDFKKFLVMNSGAAKTFTLPAVIVTNVGLPITLLKRGAGKLTIQAGGADTIEDSTAGGTLYNDLAEETFALVRLRVIEAAMWVIEFFTGSGWRTS